MTAVGDVLVLVAAAGEKVEAIGEHAREQLATVELDAARVAALFEFGQVLGDADRAELTEHAASLKAGAAERLQLIDEMGDVARSAGILRAELGLEPLPTLRAQIIALEVGATMARLAANALELAGKIDRHLEGSP